MPVTPELERAEVVIEDREVVEMSSTLRFSDQGESLDRT